MRIWSEYARDGGLLFVLSGPSGSGKDAVLKEFLQLGTGVSKCVTCTTRPQRDDETDGIDYTFLTPEEFERRKAAGAFFETVTYVNKSYGTPKDWVERTLANGEDGILKIEVVGAHEVKRLVPEAVMVFLVPPSWEELEKRLRERETETEEDISGRLAQAREELKQASNYTYVIENDSISQAAQDLRAVVVAERCKVRREH